MNDVHESYGAAPPVPGGSKGAQDAACTAAAQQQASWAERHIWSASPGKRVAWLAAFAAVAFFPATLLDRWAYDRLFVPGLYDQDWARFLRELGWYPTWVIVSLALWLATRRARPLDASPTTPAFSLRPGPRAAAYLFVTPAVSGIVCEILKLVIRRARPEIGAGEYLFRAWSDRSFSTAGLATPSSHAMVVFAAATALGRIFPGTGVLWYPLAAGTVATRVMAHGHFVSDVTLGALLGWVVGWSMLLVFSRGVRSAQKKPRTPGAIGRRSA